MAKYKVGEMLRHRWSRRLKIQIQSVDAKTYRIAYMTDHATKRTEEDSIGLIEWYYEIDPDYVRASNFKADLKELLE